jgi:DNA replication ATP-dependent helicase Dna2
MLDPVSKTRLINTDCLNPQALDSSNGSRIINPVEALICSQLVEAFISVGIPARDIGVVTLYRSQLSLLKQNLRHHLPDLEMHTADRFQGRDKEVIIMSCVRSNSERKVGDLLRDWRRVNVAFTRARTKMLIVGSKNTLRDGSELLGRFIRLMDERGWIYDLPPAAAENHALEDYGAGSGQRSPLNKSSLSPKRSPTEKRQRAALSPIKNKPSQINQRTPEKTGGKALDGARIIGRRPVLRDVYNDAIG